MRKPDLAAIIADKADISNDKASDVLNAILDEITNSLSKKESVSLIGFGTFENRHRNARAGKNPQTGETIQIAASNTVGFKPGKALKTALN
jgi:DNA-binding protein HU-alpha